MTPTSPAANRPFIDPAQNQLPFQPFLDSTHVRLGGHAPQQSPSISDPSPAGMQLLTQGERIKAMAKCVNNLRYLGVESEVPLPKVCMVGDQSAGKSSLVETLSGIKVPRAEGCCTRCPFEVNLVGNDGPWNCRIFLIKEYDYISGTSASHKASRKHPMGPWTPRAQAQVQLFGATEDREKIRDLIHHAQLAILNPTGNSDRYLPGVSVQEVNQSACLEVKFSPNIIRLDIQGPEYCNLSFTDLPGIITMSEVKSERYLVDLVANLMKEHIRRQNCIIILTLPMNTDVENSTAFAMIRDHGAEERTMGVLTKPDTIQSQAPLLRWEEMLLNNSSFHLGHEFHAVMMDPDIALSREAVLKREEAFFHGGEWRTISLTTPAKLGIPSLTLRLERLLASKISDELPNIIGKVNGRFQAIQNELQKYPARPSLDRYQFELGQLISKLGFVLTNLFEGQGIGKEASSLMQKWSIFAQAFRKALMESRPDIAVSSADEQKLMAKLRASSKPPTPSRTSKSESIPTSVEISSDDETSLLANFGKRSKCFQLEYIGACNGSRSSTHIPGQISPRAIEDLNRESVRHWEQPALDFLTSIGQLVRKEVQKLAENVFANYRKTEMYMVALGAINDFLKKAFKDQEEEVAKAFRTEHEHPLTLDEEAMVRGKAQAMQVFRRRRDQYRIQLLQAKIDCEAPPKGKAKVVDEKDIALVHDPFGLHITIMASVRAYYLVATSRYVDNICLGIQSRLFARCAREIEEAVTYRLGTGEDTVEARARVVRLMSDDPQSEVERTRLLAEHDRLRKAQEHLERVLGGRGVDNADKEVEGVMLQEAVDGSAATDMESGEVLAGSKTNSTPQTPGRTGKRKRSPEMVLS